MTVRVSTRDSQIADVRERGVQDISGQNGLVFFAILYVLKYFSSKERMLTSNEVFDVVADIMNACLKKGADSLGDDQNGNKNREDAISEKTVHRYLNILSGVKPSEGRKWDCRGYEEMILHQMGGRVLSVGGRKKKYYFACDIDGRDPDLILDYIRKDAKRYPAERIFDESEGAYIEELCDLIFPGVCDLNRSSGKPGDPVRNRLEKSLKNLKGGTSGTKHNGFLAKYRMMHDVIADNEKAECGNLPRKCLEIRLRTRSNSTSNVMQGENDGPVRFAPDGFQWKNNELYVEGIREDDLKKTPMEDVPEKPPGERVSYRLRDLIVIK